MASLPIPFVIFRGSLAVSVGISDGDSFICTMTTDNLLHYAVSNLKALCPFHQRPKCLEDP